MTPRARPAERAGTATVPSAAAALPPGTMPVIGIGELVAALHRRREGRLRAVEELRATLALLAESVERRRARIAHLKSARDATADGRDGT